MKSLLWSLLVASVAAFSVKPTTSKSSNTVLFVKHGNLGQMALAQKWGPAILQGGSDVGYYVNTSDEECDVDDPTCSSYIQPECDVMGAQGSLVNSQVIGPYKVQGGANNDWSSNAYSMSSINEIQNAQIEEFLTGEE